MIPHPFGYIIVILVQEAFVVGLIWAAMYLLNRSRRERRRYFSAMLLSNAAATNDLAALAGRLSDAYDGIADPVPRGGRAGVAQEEWD